MKLPRAGGRYFVRLTCCLLVIATIPPLVLGAILFGNARQNMSRQMALFSQNYLGQTLNAMEVVFSQIEDSGRQTILDSSFKTFETFTDGKGMEKLISSLEVGENLRGTARYLEAKARMLEQLRSFELTNAFIDSIYFCDSGKGLVYSSAGLQYGMADFFDKEWFGYADQAFISPAVMDTRTVDFPYKGNQQVITLVFRSYYNEMNLMAVNIDARKFYDQIVLKIERKGTDSLFAYSGEGELLLKDYRYPELQQLIQRERVDAFRDGQYHWDSGKLGLLSYLESDKLGWNFVMVSDVQQLYQGVEALQMVFLLSLAGVTACVILAAAVASRRLYSPIERLMEIVGESPRKSGWKNEFDGLAGVFEELKMNEMDLVERLQNSLPVHRRRFLISLLRRNDYSEEEVRRQFKLLNIGLDDRSLRIVLFSYDALEEGDRFGPLSIKKDLLLSYLLDNLRPYPFELAEMEDGKVVALLNAAEGDTAQLMDKLEGMRRELARAAQIPCTVVLSGQIGEVGELRRAYLEAERALLRRELSDEDGVLFADAPAGEKGVLRYSIDKKLHAFRAAQPLYTATARTASTRSSTRSSRGRGRRPAGPSGSCSRSSCRRTTRSNTGRCKAFTWTCSPVSSSSSTRRACRPAGCTGTPGTFTTSCSGSTGSARRSSGSTGCSRPRPTAWAPSPPKKATRVWNRSWRSSARTAARTPRWNRSRSSSTSTPPTSAGFSKRRRASSSWTT